MIGVFTKGQHVSVYPHGRPHQAAEAVVVLISENQKSIAVQFEDKPPFATARDGIALGEDPDTGKMGVFLFASRYDFGPWVELFGRGHYEIDPLD